MRTPLPFAAKRALSLVLFAGMLGAVSVADAREYSIFIDIVDSDQLRELYYEGVLPEDEFDILLTLIENPIDLNRSGAEDVFQLPGIDAGLASAIVEERILNGPFSLLPDLVSRVEGVDWRLLETIRPFVQVRPTEGAAIPLKAEMGFITFKQFRAVQPITTEDYAARSHSPGQLGYDKWPNFAIGANATVMGFLDFGFAGTAQEGLWNATYDPHSRDVAGAYGTPVFRPYMLFGRVRRQVGRARIDVLAGSYQLNFGEGLVMNTLGGRKRVGHSVPTRLSVERSDNRFREWDGLLGGVGRVIAPLSGGAELDVSVFGSLRNYDQYVGFVKVAGGQVFDPAADNGLDTPRTWVSGSRIAYQTLPNLFRVGVLGGNATFRINKRTHLGVTGYVGLIDRTVMNGVEDDNELLLKRRWPVKKNFGSVGLNGRVGFGLLEISGEYALSVGDQVGQGMILFVEVEPAWGRFIFTARHYDVKFANPFAKAQATPRVIAGLRTRGEQGLRFKAVIEPIKQIGARVSFDVNRSVLLDVWDIETKGSFRGRPLDWLMLEVLTTYANQNLEVNGRQHVYSGSLSVNDLIEYNLAEDLDDTSLNRAGERLSLAFGARADHKKIGAINVRYTRTWTDFGKTYQVGNSGSCDEDFLQGHSLRVWGNVKPTKTTTVTSSFKIQNQDVSGNKSPSSSDDTGPHGFNGYVALSQKVGDKLTLRLRGGLGKRLPNAPSPCDFDDDDVFFEPVAYDPTPYNLRWFGDFLFQMRLKF
ncbi:MAG: helix-hairpin-helix domain-containing protein [Deltaproteobacteria bacterium]|nr:helix-hairpin-helix domain-containing protein [Deltaproteobacteria bacterium]